MMQEELFQDLCRAVFRRTSLQCWKMNWDYLGRALVWMLNRKDEKLGFSVQK